MAEVTPSGSGGPIHLTRPAVDGPLEIRGGLGGISFQLEELVGGAEKLDAAAEELAAVEAEVRRIWEDLCPYGNEPRPTGTVALMDVREAQWSVQAVRTELQHISQQVRDCKTDYEAAEAWAGLSRGIGAGLGNPETLARQAGDLWLGRVPNGEVAELAIGPIAMGALLALSPERFLMAIGADLAAGRHIAAAVPLLTGLGGRSISILQPRPVTFERKETLPIEFDGSPAALLERTRIINERGEGYIEVIEVNNGGQKAYVVVVPGTQPAGEGMAGDNPFDEAGIVEGLGHSSAEINTAILRALQDAGAAKGASVVAVGYSQGGIHAMNLAADELFLNEYDMKYVLTAGSPVGGIVPAASSSLHLEHRQDWVPGGDATPSPDTRDRVTVTMNQPVRTPEGEDPGLGPGHRLSNYTEGARLVAASDDPSLVASTAVLGGVLGAGGTATATRFALSRSKPPEPQPALRPVPTPMPQDSPQPPPGDRSAQPGQPAGR